MLKKVIPDLLFDLQSAGGAFEDMKQMGLSGALPLGEVKTKAPSPRVPLVPPRCGIWARRHHAEMAFMNELWFAVVPPPSAPTSFLCCCRKHPGIFLFLELVAVELRRRLNAMQRNHDAGRELRRSPFTDFQSSASSGIMTRWSSPGMASVR